jgi:excisionase family DNA binding protein
MSQILTVREMADYLRVHQATVYRLLKCRELPAFKVGNDWRFNFAEITRWQQRQQSGFNAARKISRRNVGY